MDYLLFYSQYSSSSQKVLEDFPSLIEKSVSVDSKQIRMYLKNLSIVSVPTLVLILHDKIIDRIIGYENIVDWLNITIYRTDQIRNVNVEQEEIEQFMETRQSPQQLQSQQLQSQQIPQQSQQIPQQSQQIPQPQQQQQQNATEYTNLDDLLLEDVETPSEDIHITRSSTNNSLLKVAEELKKERDSTQTLTKRI